MVKTKKPSTSKGFTLVELMISVAILGVVSMLVPNILMNITRFFRLNTARIETQRFARDTLSQINQNIRQAYASTVVVSQESGQPPSSNIRFSTIDGRSMKYYQQNKKLYYVVGTSTSNIADGLLYISFSYPRTDDPSILSVSLTYEKATYQGASKTLQMAIEKVRIMN